VKNNKLLRGASVRVVLAITILASPCAACAGDVIGYAGADHRYRDVTLAYAGHPFWTGTFAGDRLDFHLEVSAGLATAPPGLPHESLTHVGLTPTARYWLTAQTALEIGIGANLFSGTRIGEKRISTAFQFGDALGIRHRFAGSPWSAGLRFIHYSNADIKLPNPGQNFLQLQVGYSFD